MAFPTNPYKNLPGDGIHIAEDLIQGVGEIPQRGTNGELIAVPSGTEGQVPTYQADGTLAPANASGGLGANYELLTFGATVTPSSTVATFEPVLSGDFAAFDKDGNTAAIPSWVHLNNDGQVELLEQGLYLIIARAALVFSGTVGVVGFGATTAETLPQNAVTPDLTELAYSYVIQMPANPGPFPLTMSAVISGTGVALSTSANSAHVDGSIYKLA